MAGIDWIHGDYDQWHQLHRWIAKSNRSRYCEYFASTPLWTMDKEKSRIFSAPCYVDRWLWDNCPFIWVREELEYMYNDKPPSERWARFWDGLPQSIENAGSTMSTIGFIWAFMIINPNPKWSDVIYIFVAAFFSFVVATIIKAFKEDWSFWKQTARGIFKRNT